ncbi:hypothetical protein EVA_12125 [gut metagenome]|uniref:Uncharacterized protein n=1 Tax=gut metagenome TaxID=749906 RepID=J9GJJ8_9ZZZZ
MYFSKVLCSSRTRHSFRWPFSSISVKWSFRNAVGQSPSLVLRFWRFCLCFFFGSMGDQFRCRELFGGLLPDCL